MSHGVPFDVRWPVGALFAVLGGLLLIEGLREPAAGAAAPTGVPINLVWGGVLLGFGAVTLALALRARKRG
ncbi:MAG: hypothetical protein HYX65_04180 [Gemmatimonadetes bacterium]|nr:hypothetical protein [Gemmatimonadota bacterium]